MTKRDFITASLPSTQDLRMASEHETDVPMTLITGLHRTETASGYIRQPVPIRIITAFIQLFCSTKFPDTCPSSTNSVAPKNCEYGNVPAELVEEVDSSGHSCVRSLEYISLMESLVTSGTDMEIKWMAGTKPPSWPTIGAVILAYLKIPIHGCESSLAHSVTTSSPNYLARLATTQHSVPGSSPVSPGRQTCHL